MTRFLSAFTGIWFSGFPACHKIYCVVVIPAGRDTFYEFGTEVREWARFIQNTGKTADTMNDTYHIHPMTMEHAREISTWTYEGPYAVYSFQPDGDTLAELTGGDYRACTDKDGRRGRRPDSHSGGGCLPGGLSGHRAGHGAMAVRAGPGRGVPGGGHGLRRAHVPSGSPSPHCGRFQPAGYLGVSETFLRNFIHPDTQNITGAFLSDAQNLIGSCHGSHFPPVHRCMNSRVIGA